MKEEEPEDQKEAVGHMKVLKYIQMILGRRQCMKRTRGKRNTLEQMPWECWRECDPRMNEGFGEIRNVSFILIAVYFLLR